MTGDERYPGNVTKQDGRIGLWQISQSKSRKEQNN